MTVRAPMRHAGADHGQGAHVHVVAELRGRVHLRRRMDAAPAGAACGCSRLAARA